MLPFGRLWYTKPDDAIGYAMHYSRSHDAVIRVYDDAGNVIETHGHVSTHPAEANHSNLHIYFAKVVLVEEPKNCEGAVRYPQWNMQRLLFAWCSFAQMGPTPPRTLRKISAAASMPNGGAVK